MEVEAKPKWTLEKCDDMQDHHSHTMIGLTASLPSAHVAWHDLRRKLQINYLPSEPARKLVLLAKIPSQQMAHHTDLNEDTARLLEAEFTEHREHSYSYNLDEN